MQPTVSTAPARHKGGDLNHRRGGPIPTLNARQSRFVAEYLIDGNATQAAIRAGYSARTANQIGSRLLANVGVRAAIKAAQDKLSQRLELTAERVRLEIARVVDVDPARLYDADGALLHPKDMPEDVRRAISSFTVEVETVNGKPVGRMMKIKMLDKNAAFGHAARFLGIGRDNDDDRGGLSIHIHCEEEPRDVTPPKDHRAARLPDPAGPLRQTEAEWPTQKELYESRKSGAAAWPNINVD